MIERFSFCLFVYYLHKPVICKVGLLPPEPVRSYIRQFQGVSSCRHHCPSRPLKLLLLLPQQISLLELRAVNFQMMNPERLHTLYSPDKSNRHRTSICPSRSFTSVIVNTPFPVCPFTLLPIDGLLRIFRSDTSTFT